MSQGTKRSQKGWITATKQNESGVMVKSAGALELQDVNVRTSGSSSSSDDSSFYGLDAGVLTEGTVTISKSSVTTSGDGANGMFAYGTKAVIDASNVTVRASGQYAHGIMSSGGGTIDARDLNVSTQGASSAAVATDRGGGTIKVSGGIFRTSGMNSPGIYSTGSISARGATFVARGAEAAVIEGSNSVTLDNSRLTAGKNRGVMIYQSFSGDAQGQSGVFTMSGGRLSSTSGPLFYVTNTSALIKLSGASLWETSGVLLDAAAGAWGRAGSNGGTVVLNAVDQSLAGAVEADKISAITINLTGSSVLTGAVNSANTAKSIVLTLDKSSKWVVTGTSYITVLRDSAGLTGASVPNIVGNGHTVYYDRADNPSLAGKTYELAGGGVLKPAP